MTRHDDLDDKKPSAPIQGAYEGLLASSGVNGDTECLDWNTQEDIIAYAASSFLFIVENTVCAPIFSLSQYQETKLISLIT